VTDNQPRDAEEFKTFNKTIVAEFRTNAGKVGGQFEKTNLLLLATTGAKSGLTRITPLAYFTIEGKMVVVGSYAGSDVDPAWVLNLRAEPRARVEVGADSYDVLARELARGERDAYYPQIVSVAPNFGEYAARTTRVIPLFELART
jgi:deazaflavin-dependent oxidoreductase (nitroreductase family)